MQALNAQTIIKENWFTQKPHKSAVTATTTISLFLLIVSYIFLLGLFKSSDWMPANPEAVFHHHQLWRLWTALFAHADLGHLMNNSLMFLPLTYLLTSYFGFYLFPIVGLFMGGLINWIVLKYLPLEASLIGMSGVVYWMGATWLTLYLLIDSRKTMKLRFSIVLFLSVLLFAPQTYRPEVSYLSHFLGYIFGIASACIYYLIHKKDFQSAEVKEYIFEDPIDTHSFIFEQGGVQHPEPGTLKAQL